MISAYTVTQTSSETPTCNQEQMLDLVPELIKTNFSPPMIYGLVAQLMGRLPLQKDPLADTGPNQLPFAQKPYYSRYFLVLDLGYSLKHSQVTQQVHRKKVTSSAYMASSLMRKTTDLTIQNHENSLPHTAFSMVESFKIKYTQHYVFSATIFTAQHMQQGNILQIISWGKLKVTFNITYLFCSPNITLLKENMSTTNI